MPEPGISTENSSKNEEADDSFPGSPEIHFEPVVQLPLVEVPTNEENEEEMIKLRAKLYRYDTSDSPAEWKERGTGDVKLLRHKINNSVRVVMRRDKTLKICANHFIRPWMELNPNCGSDRAWVWSTYADFADEQAKSQLLAIRFANVENAKAWKEAFEKAKKIVETECKLYSDDEESDGDNESDSDSESEKTKPTVEVNVSGEDSSSDAKKDCEQNSSLNKSTEEKETVSTDDLTSNLDKLKVEGQE